MKGFVFQAVALSMEDDEVVLAGQHEVDGKWLQEMRNSSSVSETCSATDLCERSHFNIVPRVVIASEEVFNSATRIRAVADLLVGLRDKYAFDGFTFECSMALWRPFVSLLR